MGLPVEEVLPDHTQIGVELRKLRLSYFEKSRLVNPYKNGGKQICIYCKCMRTLERGYELTKEYVDRDDQKN